MITKYIYKCLRCKNEVVVDVECGVIPEEKYTCVKCSTLGEVMVKYPVSKKEAVEAPKKRGRRKK